MLHSFGVLSAALELLADRFCYGSPTVFKLS
jgi:hypothetical protein